MPLGDINMTDDQVKALQTGYANWQAQHNSPAVPTTTPTTTPDASSTPSIVSQVTPTQSSSPATGTTGTTASSGGVLGAMANNAVPHATVGAVTVPMPISTQMNQAATNPTPASKALGVTPEMQANSSKWKPNPNNDPAITASNNALHQQNLQLASQRGLVWDAPTGSYKYAPGYDYLDANGQPVKSQGTDTIIGADGKTKITNNIVNDRNNITLEDLERVTGLTGKIDPMTGLVSIGGQTLKPNSYQNGEGVFDLRNATGALGFKINWDPKTSTATITDKKVIQKDPGTDTGGGAGTGGNNQGYMNNIISSQPQQPQMQPWQQPDLSSFQNNMMPYQSFDGNMNQYYDQAHSNLQPTFDANNQKLIDKQNLDINGMNESMNRRGIFSSGIAQAAENDLRAKTTNAIASSFTAQMAQVQKTAQTLYDNAYKQFMQGNQFALKNNQDQMTNMLNQEKQSFSQYLSTQKLNQAQYSEALKAWDQVSGMIQKNAQMDMQDNHYQQTMAFNQYKFNNPSAAQQLPYEYQTANNQATNATSADNNAADNQTKANIALLPYQQMTQYQYATTQEKQQMDAAINYFKQQGISIDESKLMESIRHNQTTEGETATHDRATEANAAQVTKQNQTKETNTNLYDIWKATGKAPAGIAGVTAGTPFVNDTATKIDPKASYDQHASLMSQLDSGRVNGGIKDGNGNLINGDGKLRKAQAIDIISKNQDVLTDADYRDLQDWANKTFVN